MPELIIDANGIWTDNAKNAIDYPDTGNTDSYKLEEGSFWFLHRNQVLLRVIKRFPFQHNYADVGAGNGFQAQFVSRNFPGREIFIIEPGYAGCLNARKRGLKNVYNVMFEKVDFTFHNIDAVGLYDVIEHIEMDDEFLRSLKSKLPPRSLIYITVPAHNYLWSDADDFGKHYRRYSLKMLRNLSRRAGLEYLYGSYFFSYLPLLTFILRSLPYRIRGRRNDKNLIDAETEQHNPSPLILKIFNFFQRIELKKISTSGIKAGASCIAVFKT